MSHLSRSIAALACAAVQFVVDPHSCGVGGYMVMTYHRAGQQSPSPIFDAPAIAQIFSVQDRSDCETVANVSTIWWASSSSSGPSGPRSVMVVQLRSRT